MAAGNIQRGSAARIGHQVVHRLGAIDREVAPQRRLLWLCATAPQRIIKAIAFEDGDERNRFVIRLCLAQVLEQLCPTFCARRVLADSVQCCVDHLSPLVADNARRRIYQKP
jgi:hypothetical protein